MFEENKSARLSPEEQFFQAVQRGVVEDCKKLMTSSIDVNRKDSSGNTVIFLCTTSQHIKVLRYLISIGASINHMNSIGNTCLHCAVENGCMEVILILLLNGADISIQNQNKQKPEDIAPKLKPMIIALSNDRQAYQILNDNHKKKLTAIFDDIDRDASGILTLDKSLRFNRYTEDIPYETARRDAQDFLRDVGICHSGQVNLDEWLFSFGKLLQEQGNEALDHFFDDYERVVREKGKFEDFVPKD